MKKILISILTIGVIGVSAVAASNAYFSDTETSTGNTISAGKLDLKVDSTAHYDGMVCINNGGYKWTDEDADASNNPRPELLGTACTGTWPQDDLDETRHFFDVSDVKPGDFGENTVSLHVINNDAWGRVTVVATKDADMDCTEAELDVETECTSGQPFDGELGHALQFHVWLDEGLTPGFQNKPSEEIVDATEGDNIKQEYENVLATPGPLGVDEANNTETYSFAPLLQAAYAAHGCTDTDGNTNYAVCQGYASDGRMVGSTSYELGFAWDLPSTVGNEVQSDSYMADISFDTAQHRNQANPF